VIEIALLSILILGLLCLIAGTLGFFAVIDCIAGPR
jgi:hypothetical protein